MDRVGIRGLMNALSEQTKIVCCEHIKDPN